MDAACASQVDIDEDGGKGRAVGLPVVPEIPQTLVDSAPIFDAGQVVSVRKPLKRNPALFRFAMLMGSLERVQKHVVALSVELPVHVGREDEAGDVHTHTYLHLHINT